jgi:hypothetical protein
LAKAIAVLCSDIHYSLPNLKLADAAMRMAIAKANELQVPLIVAGDLHDTKANLRGECVNAMIDTFKTYDIGVKYQYEEDEEFEKLLPFVLVGNHDKIHEKSQDNSLNFLNGVANIISKPGFTNEISCNRNSLWFIPYQHDINELKKAIKRVEDGAVVIMHQGITGSNAGEYIQDKSAITKDDVAGMRVISGHYHTRQTIALPDNGVWDYIGNPFTQNFGEANDPPKGFQILNEDGSLIFVPTNLRKHVIWNEYFGVNTNQPSLSRDDLLWFKMHGTKEQLSNFNRSQIPLSMPFKLDLIPIDTKVSQVNTTQNLTQSEVLDSLIDSLTNTTDEAKSRLKQIWKDLCE